MQTTTLFNHLDQNNMKEKLKIEYLNCKKNFKKDSIEFEGSDAYVEIPVKLTTLNRSKLTT